MATNKKKNTDAKQVATLQPYELDWICDTWQDDKWEYLKRPELLRVIRALDTTSRKRIYRELRRRGYVRVAKRNRKK